MKIKANFYEEVRAKMPQISLVPIKVGKETYEVGVKNFLKPEEKDLMLESMLEFIQEEGAEELTEQEILTITTVVLYEAITDIEFPEEPVNKVRQFTALAEQGVLSEVKKFIRPELMAESINYLHVAMDMIRENSEKMLEKSKTMTKTLETPEKAIGRPIQK